MRLLPLSLATLLLAAPVAAQQRFAFSVRGDDRAALGLTFGDPTLADTLGPRIQSVTEDGPAARAGLRAGQHVAAIAGTSLAISRTDAEDPLTSDAGYRRLVRALAAVEAGDTIALAVIDGGQRRTVRVATVAMRDLDRARRADAEAAVSRLMRRSGGDRAALGLALSGTGTARDTLGVFVSSVVAGGPAEKAGIVEGARIASIDGMDVRVPREDAGDATAASNRVTRLTRSLGEKKPGDAVRLRVWQDGRWRDVQVATVHADSLPSDGFGWRVGDGAVFRFDGDALPRLAPGGVRGFRFEGDDGRMLRIEPGEGGRMLRIEPGADGVIRLDGRALPGLDAQTIDGLRELRGRQLRIERDRIAPGRPAAPPAPVRGTMRVRRIVL